MSPAPAASLPRDLEDLVLEVVAQVPRLLALQDRDPDSPMRGCLHPAYWRDKSSDVADMRRQEAALALALLWRHELPGNSWRGDRQVLQAALRALGFWTRGQHEDGTFDEWYKNEHGYATTAFSSFAMALTAETLGDALTEPLAQSVRTALARAGRWLATHDDWFKTNHQAVGVAALGAVGRLLGDSSLLAAAERNAGLIAGRMHPEGWSKEISGLDVGYTFLLAEYLAMHAVVTGNTAFLPAISKAYRFAASFLHPDLTTGAEYGICGNAYFSRVATVALAPHDEVAARVLRWMDRPSTGPRDTSATLKDDLRLARYAYQPLVAALLHSGGMERRDLQGVTPRAGPPLLFETTREVRWHPAALLLAIRRPGHATWAAGCQGGFVRIAFAAAEGFRTPVGDRGYAYEAQDGVHRNARYSLDATASFEGADFQIEAPFVRAGFVMPPYLARVGLRIATSLPWGHRWSRWLIDQWRRRKGTALNQSSAGVARGGGRFRLHRKVRFDDDAVRIEDRLTSRSGKFELDRLFAVLDGPLSFADGSMPDVDRRVPILRCCPEIANDGSLRITKTFRVARDDAILVEVG